MKIAAASLAAALLSSLLKESKPEFVLPLQLCFVVVVCSVVISLLFKNVSGIFERYTGSVVSGSYISVMLKGVLVSLVCTVCASLCRENGNRALADAVELSGRAVILVFCVPLIKSVLETALMYVK